MLREENSYLAQALSLQIKQVKATVQLLEEGGTVPFIARYRKEVTGGLDEVQIAAIRDGLAKFRELEKRRAAILKSIEEQGKLSPELQKSIEAADTLTILEDLYLPYKPKRKTKASIAREKGLEPLALWLLTQENTPVDRYASAFVDSEKGVSTIEEALSGARDIVAETINEDAITRQKLRVIYEKESVLTSKVVTGKELAAEKYKDYFDWKEPLMSIPSHRLLAIRRGEKELFLLVDIAPEEQSCIDALENIWMKNASSSAQQIKLAIKDAYKRLLQPSLETEFRLLSKEKADLNAIHVFAQNIKELLMASPLGQKRVLAIDPGFKTGCKVVCLDAQGKLLHFTPIYPHEPQRQLQAAAQIIQTLVEKFDIEAIAIGNGTAGRETESFVKSLQLPNVWVVSVNESGASVYSASEVAREEFPNEDVTVRGAVSIGRRLMDPLAELVKIDPKAIGVGQYQHDVDQNQLKHALDDVVTHCVNAVGVEVNTASKELLSYVAGLGPQLAQNIVQYRNEHGAFKSRNELKKVPRLGDKAFEQSAGFLRIRDAKHPLDRSAVHPERYHLVEQMAKDLGVGIETLISDKSRRTQIDLKKYINDQIGLPTLTDILQELDKPGRDPRAAFEQVVFNDHIKEPKDLKVGMKLPGIVTNVTNFGAFVDVGVHQDGLVHISHLSDQFVKDPHALVKVAQKVEVTVTEVDLQRKRIALSMKKDPFATGNVHAKSASKAPKPKEKDHSMEEMLEKLKGKFK